MFKLIENSDNFSINKEGVVIDGEGKIKNNYRNGDGYITVAIRKNGHWVTMGVHRLLALSFLPFPEETEVMTVNHIDSNKENNSLDNLDWCTVSQNNIHKTVSEGTSEFPKLIFIKPDKETLLVDNLNEASKLLKVSIKEVWFAVKFHTKINGVEIIPNIGVNLKDYNLQKSNDRFLKGYTLMGKRPISVLDITTKEVFDFESLHEASVYFKTLPSHLHQAISKDNRVRLFKGNFIVVDSGDQFPAIDENQIETSRRASGKSVIASRDNKVFKIYNTAAGFIRETNLSKKSVTVNLRNNKLKRQDGWVYTYVENFNKDSFSKLFE